MKTEFLDLDCFLIEFTYEHQEAEPEVGYLVPFWSWDVKAVYVVSDLIFDPHYKLIDNDLFVEEEYEYVKEKEYNLNDVKVNKGYEYYEERPAVNWLGREKWAKVYRLEFN